MGDSFRGNGGKGAILKGALPSPSTQILRVLFRKHTNRKHMKKEGKTGEKEFLFFCLMALNDTNNADYQNNNHTRLIEDFRVCIVVYILLIFLIFVLFSPSLLSSDLLCDITPLCSSLLLPLSAPLFVPSFFPPLLLLLLTY